jgi:hypothetical protein
MMTRPIQPPTNSEQDPVRKEIGITMAMSAVAAICLFWPIAAAAQAVDPVENPDTWRTAGPYWLVILAGYAILRAFLRENHVLAQGRVLTALTGAAMVASAILSWHFQGAPLSGIWTATALAIALLIHPEVPAAQAAALLRQIDPVSAPVPTPVPTPPSSPASGTPSSGTPRILTIALMIAALSAGLSGGVACGGSAGERAGAIAAGGSTAFLGCEFSQLPPDTLNDIESLASSTVQRWLTGRGTIDEDGLRADMHLLHSALGQCAIAAAIGAVRSSGSGSTNPGTSSAALVADPDQIAQAFTRLRAELGWLPTQEELSWSHPKVNSAASAATVSAGKAR